VHTDYMYCYTVNWSSLWLYWRCSRYSTSNQQWRGNSDYCVDFGEELNTRKVVRTADTSNKSYLHGCDRPFHLYALYSSDLNGKWSKMYIGRHVKCPLFLYDFIETIIFLTDCRKNSSIKFHENPSSRSRVVPRGRTDRRTDM